MRKFKTSLLVLLVSLFAGNLAPVWSNFQNETSPPETAFFANNIESAGEINAIPSSNTQSVKSVKSSTFHQAALQFYRNSLPESHNQIVRIDQKTSPSSDNKYLNFLYDFQTIK